MRALGIALGVATIGVILAVVLVLRAHDSTIAPFFFPLQAVPAAAPDEPSSAPARVTADTPHTTTGEAVVSAVARDDDRFDGNAVADEPLVITGRVVDEAKGQPIANAEVAADYEFKNAVRTDVDGKYTLTLDKVEPFDFKVEARAAGFGRREHRCQEILGTTLSIDFELPAPRRASGRVVAADGTPIADATVSAHAFVGGSEGQMRDRVETRSRADGSFVLTDLRPDLQHQLRVAKRGFGTLVYCFPAEEKALPEVDFAEIVLAPAAAIAVSVLDDAGAPIVAANLQLRGGNTDWLRFTSVATPGASATGLWERRGTPDATGRFVFDDLACGSYQLQTWMLGHVSDSPIDCVIAADELRKEFTFTIVRGLAIAGRVVDETGHPVRDAWMYVQPDGRPDRPSIGTRSDEQGRFRIFGLEAGDYQLYPEEALFQMLQGNRDAVSIRVAAGKEDVVVTRPTVQHDTIRGIVRDKNGSPISCAWVFVLLDSGGDISARSHIGGRFAIQVAHGASVKLLACSMDDWQYPTDRDRLRSRAIPATAASGEVTLIYSDGETDR